MFDTNILIYLMKHRPASVAARINALGEDATLCMSFFTYAELLNGAERSTQRARVLKQLDSLVDQIPVVFETGRVLCEEYARQSLQLKRRGTPIAANDLWIACHALAQQATLVSHNVREFERIDGLTLEDWV